MSDAAAYPRYLTIIHALARAAELHPAAPGFMCQGRLLNYGEYAQSVAALASIFAEAVAASGSRSMTNSVLEVARSVAMAGGRFPHSTRHTPSVS